jgi:aspartokinase-like uncharacterized kinase
MIRIVKVGGSLFDLPELPQRLRAWLSAQSPALNVLIAGGGTLVDQVRHWHASGDIDEALAHWMCVDLLNVTARLLHARLPEFPLIEDVHIPRERAAKPGATVFSPTAWLRRIEPGLPGMRLPCTWETTSDAISGRVAVVLRADELVLLKSALPRCKEWGDLSPLADNGYIDAVLPRMAELPPMRVVNLRASPIVEFVVPKQELS